MSNVTRHPSAPRKSAPPSPRAPIVVPVLVCSACKDPVVPRVRTQPPSVVVLVVLFCLAIIPALLYLIWLEQQKRTAVTCPQCGRADLVPLDSTAGRELLGDRFDSVVARGKQLAGELAREQERQRASDARAQRIVGWALLAVVAASAVALYVAWPRRSPDDLTPEEQFAQLQQMAAEAQAAREAAPVAPAAPKPVAPAPKVLTIVASGTAAAKPHGEPVMRVTAGETYQQGEERDGWIRLKDAPVEAWVEASAVTR